MPKNGEYYQTLAFIWVMRALLLVAAVAVAVLSFFANPINWKLYVNFTAWDHAWAWISNVAIALVCGALWWWGQRSLANLIRNKRPRDRSADSSGAHSKFR